MKRKTQPIQVYVSSVIDAPVEAVWALVRDFNGLPQWHPAISESRIEGNRDSAAVGCVRHLVLRSGETVREQLLALSDTSHRITYNIIESKIGLLDYIAELALSPITDGDRTFIEWSADFTTAAAQEEAKATMVEQEVFLRGLLALNARFSAV